MIIKINFFEFELVLIYKNQIIAKEGGLFYVINPETEGVYLVGMDDSKTTAGRKFNQPENTIEGAKNYIDRK